jgi:hypothetical protein
MSTDYRSLTPISMGDLFDGRLEEFGIREHRNEETGTDHRILTDGRYYLHVYDEQDCGVAFARYAGNVVYPMLQAISETFDAEIVSEHDHRYWGFETEAEWDAFWTAKNEKHNKRSELSEAVHAVVVTLNEKDLAGVDMLTTHEDDLPQA